jgi:putative membrane protein
MLSGEERERVAAAILEAETRTAGEIVVVVAARASAYRSVPLLYTLLGALALPWPLIALTQLSATRIFAAQLVAALVLILAFSWPGRRAALVPRFVKRARAREAAAREFAARGLTGTQGRTGVLLYVAVAERYAEVIADEGIAAPEDETIWRETITELVAALEAGRAADGLEAAVGRVGRVLAARAPPRADDRDELPNKVIVI